MRVTRCAITATLLTLLSGCGTTPPTNYYVLSSPAALHDIGGNPVSLGIGPVQVADYLDRVQISLKTDNSLLVDEFNHWGEPLAVGIRRVMMEELAVQLDTLNLVQFPWRADEVPDLRVKIMVLELNRVKDQAILKAAWSLAETEGGEALHQGVDVFEEPVHRGGYDALVEAYSKLLHQLSLGIATEIKEYSAASRAASGS